MKTEHSLKRATPIIITPQKTIKYEKPQSFSKALKNTILDSENLKSVKFGPQVDVPKMTQTPDLRTESSPMVRQDTRGFNRSRSKSRIATTMHRSAGGFISRNGLKNKLSEWNMVEYRPKYRDQRQRALAKRNNSFSKLNYYSKGEVKKTAPKFKSIDIDTLKTLQKYVPDKKSSKKK